MAHSESLAYQFSSDSVAVILAATVGSRLFPVTSLDDPKHLLPLAGVPILTRLLSQIHAAGFVECVVAIAQDDRATVPLLKSLANITETSLPTTAESSSSLQPPVALQCQPQHATSSLTSPLKIIVFALDPDDDCSGSAQALACVERAQWIHPASHVCVIPGDAVILQAHGLSRLARIPQQDSSVACAVLLSDQGQVDEQGVPLKESAKQKKGNLARDDEDIEYMALSYKPASDSAPRIVWKQAKLEVEQDGHMTSATPKLILPKARLRHGITKVRTDWSDVHVYALSPWVRKLIMARTSLVSLQGDLIPLLVARQFRGKRSTFGAGMDAKVVDEALEQTAAAASVVDESSRGVPARAATTKVSSTASDEYSVLAVVQNAVERAHSIPAYLHATKQVIARLVESADTSTAPEMVLLPTDASVNAKFSTIMLPGPTMGAKVTVKGSVIGSGCKIADKCRLNNVVVLDNVTIGANTILQNSIIGASCVIGENCNLNDCQVAPGRAIPAGTKEKGESFTLE